MTSRGPVVDGVEYPVDLLIYASGFEVTTDLHHRLGFDPTGRGGVNCRNGGPRVPTPCTGCWPAASPTCS